MASRKPSAKAKRVAAFKSELEDLGSLFEHESARRDELDTAREHARYEKSCASKMRYPTRADALEAIAACEEHGRRGLSTYKCSYCNGWHLTSHPWT